MADEKDNLDASIRLTKDQRDRLELRRLEREEMESTYDLAKLIGKEIGKQEKILEKVMRYHDNASAQLQQQVWAIRNQKAIIDVIRAASIKYSSELQDQVNLVSGQLDLVKDLESQYGNISAVAKMARETLQESYAQANAEETKLLQLQAEKQAKEDAFAKLKARNLKLDEMRTNLGFDMVRAIQTGNQAEVEAINKKLKLTNNLIKFTSDEMDANRESVYALNQQIDTSKLLLKEKRALVAEEEKIVRNLDAEEHSALVALRNAKHVLKIEEGILENRQKIYDATMASLREEERKLISMHEEANRLEENVNKYKKIAKSIKDYINLMDKVKIIVGQVDKFLGESSEEYGKIKSFVLDIAKGGATAWLTVIKASVERWKELDKAAGEFRDKTGFLVAQTKNLDKAVREVNVSMAHIGIGLQEAYESAAALTTQFQVIGLVTKDMIKDTAEMAANLGISVQDSAKLRGMFTSIAKSSGMTATQMMGAAAKLADMGGVAPALVLKDMAEASEDTLKFLAKSPIAMMAAAVEARRMGTTMNSLSKSARGLLNFQDSITSELTASALVGRSLNFQAARRAAYEKDIVKSRQLAMKEIGKLGDFTKLNVFQQEEIAKAAGMTVDEIIQQQNQEKMLLALQRERPEMYKEYTKMQRQIKEDQDAAKKNLVKQGEEFIKNQNRQREMTKLANAFKQIWTDITDSLLPIANVIMPIIITTIRLLVIPIKIIAALVRGFLNAFDGIGKAFRSGSSGAISLEKVMTKIASVTETVSNWMEKVGETIGRVFNLYAFTMLFIGRSATVAFRPFNAIQRFFVNISNFFRGIALGLVKLSRGATSISNAFSHMGLQGSRLGRMFTIILEYTARVKNAISGWFSGSWIQRSYQAITGLIGRIRTLIGGVGARIVRLFSGKSMFSGIKNIFSGIGGSLGSFLRPLLRIFGGGGGGIFASLFKGASTIFRLFGTFAKFLGPIGLIINAIQIIWELGSKLMDIWSDDNLNIGQKILKSILAIPDAIFDVLISPFIDLGVWILKKFGVDIPDGVVDGIKNTAKDIFKWITMPFVKALDWIVDWFCGHSPSKIGLGIVEGIKSIGSMLLDFLTFPFRTALNFVSKIFGGDGELGTMIVDGIKSIGGFVFDALMWPFKKLISFASKIPFIGKFFGGSDASKVAMESKTSVENNVNQSVEIKNLDELKQSIDKLTAAIASLGGAAGAGAPIVNVNSGTDAMVAKLDELIGLLTDGAIAVNIDGALASKALARAST